jgi:hypothetical protein
MSNRILLSIASIGVISCSSWPKPVSFAAPASHAIRSVDVLPLDLSLWTEAGYDANPEQLRSTASMHIANTALGALGARSYAVDAMIDWNGDYPGGTAMAPTALESTVNVLAGYFTDATQLPKPGLPVRLGSATGADATLYVGGWAYVANHHESTANKVAEGVAIGLLVAVAAVAAYELIAAVNLPLGAGRGRASHSRHAQSSRHPVEPQQFASRGRVVREPHPTTELQVDSDAPVIQHPDWANADRMPHDGDSMMFLEATLIDNRTGFALWHAHQIFPANAASRDDVERATRELVASIPPAR